MGNDDIDSLFDAHWVTETSDLCRINTVRPGDPLNPNLLIARDYIQGVADEFNKGQKTVKFSAFQWARQFDETTSSSPSDDEIKSAEFYVFGLRLGPANASYKVATICHLDVVPADDSWTPFEPRVEAREYDSGHNGPQDFLVGRGCLDDKGPAIAAFLTGRALARKFDGTSAFDDVAFELLFDGSEETEMSTPKYMVDPAVQVPHFGIVFDAFWCTRAEKGGERPLFSTPLTDPPSGPDLHVSLLQSNPDNSANTIPDWAAATIRCADADKLKAFAGAVAERYSAFKFDDPEYYPAPLEVVASGDAVTLKTTVSGAQHGSSPEENRAEGWNPLVSLTVFLASLVDDGTLAPGAYASLCKFIAWTWGTHVFGEDHDVLKKNDDIFADGTTYAVTRVCVNKHGDAELGLDIRYSLAHHTVEWDGCTEGWVGEDAPSKFAEIFPALVTEFNAAHPALCDVTSAPDTIFAPDVRSPDTNENFVTVRRAFNEVIGYDPPMLAIGGGTDAKGMTNLLAVGPLFSTHMGPPVNYHGISEAAPIADMRQSTAVLYKIMELEVQSTRSKYFKEGMVKRAQKVVAALKRAHARGMRFSCDH